MFHIGSHRRQLIVAAELDEHGLQVYRDCKTATEDPLILKTATKIDLTRVVAGRGSFTANLTTASQYVSPFSLPSLPFLSPQPLPHPPD